MSTSRLPWTAAGAALLVACMGAGAQQPTPGQAADTAVQPRKSGPMSKRDSPQAARPAGFKPYFSTDSERFVQQGGERLYRSICQGCHMPEGQGAKGAGFYPALAQNARLAAGPYPVYVVLQGLHGMPPFGERLDDQQVADVVNYIRTHFGNDYRDAITPEMVRGQRPAEPGPR
ncbi:c-type cytochrome [Melaminivora alkalimesophila]|uniref:Mono/diheme cytochrome c family protein n=1 Tax=Melaminivora alkalimesophila TaxID=1165852 RepID=A0A317RKW6_9BURK|nr:cytochrome c [Melaminivora alkalimesophila]PWW49110.1 mono/diheme cytochrome c family protein [Melaminivora alkalimesophila]